MNTESFAARFAPQRTVADPNFIPAHVPPPADVRDDSLAGGFLSSDSHAAPSNVPHRPHPELFHRKKLRPEVRDKLFDLFYKQHKLAEAVAEKCGLSKRTIVALRAEARGLRNMSPKRVAQLRARVVRVGSAEAANRMGGTVLSHLRWLEQHKELDPASIFAQPEIIDTAEVSCMRTSGRNHLVPEERETIIGRLMTGDPEERKKLSASGISRRTLYTLRREAEERLSLTPQQIETLRAQLDHSEVGEVAENNGVHLSTMSWIEAGAVVPRSDMKHIRDAEIEALIDELRTAAQIQTHRNPAAVRSDVHPPYPGPEFVAQDVVDASFTVQPDVAWSASEFATEHGDDGQLVRLPSDEIDEAFRSALLAYLDGSPRVDASSTESPSMTLVGTKRSAEASDSLNDRKSQKRSDSMILKS